MSKHNTRMCLGASVFVAAIGINGCGGSGSSSTSTGPTTPSVVLLPGFTQTNLISDQAGTAPLTDPNLVNPWGIAYAPTGPWWVANNTPGLAGIYSGGNVGGATMTNLSPSGIQIPFGSPTGQVYNGTTDFQVSGGGTSGPALFIFSSQTGWIDGWNPTVNAGSAEAPVDLSGSGAVFKGLAIGSNTTGNFIYATDFHNGQIDVFDKNFNQATLSGAFSDPNIPTGFAPFGIQNLNGTLFVTYASQSGSTGGYVDKFDTNGNLMGRVASNGNLNSPWGLAMAPASFGKAAGLLLVGNLGDGKINVFNPATAAYVGTLAGANNTAIVNPGLWGLSFGNGGSAGDTTSLYFTAGPSGYGHGLFGRINAPAAAGVVKPAAK